MTGFYMMGTLAVKGLNLHNYAYHDSDSYITTLIMTVTGVIVILHVLRKEMTQLTFTCSKSPI